MIKENQRLFNQLNIISDGIILFLTLPLAFWIRFFVLPNGIITVPLHEYITLDVSYTVAQIITLSAFRLYRSFRHTPLRKELPALWKALLLDSILLLGWLFLFHDEHYSRWTLAIALSLNLLLLSGKRVLIRKVLRYYRLRGYNLKYVLILGNGAIARRYIETVRRDKALGYQPIGYVADTEITVSQSLPWIGKYNELDRILEKYNPDEVISALELEDFSHTPKIITACDKAGIRLSIIPFYCEYIPSEPQYDELDGIPLMNIRRIPLDNWANALCKRTVDILGSALLLIVTSPIMLFCAIGVKLSSPGPVIFRQERVGRDKKTFYMYKFRSMRMNNAENTAWSTKQDNRKTKFGAFLRKCSLDEFPQFWNVLKGDMSLVGPRPELPYYVEQFKEDIPFYMVKHQVRPGITGWAQVNNLRGDTSIEKRVRYDLYYIEHWSLQFDIQILLMTIFKGKFMNDEQLQ